MNIALFGGSFDPPHFGHKEIIKQALQALDIDLLIVMPTYLNPFKNNSHYDPQTRLELTKEMANEFQKVQVSDFEVLQNEKVATIQTVDYLYNQYKIEKFYVIIGADNLEKLHLWNSFEELNEKVEFVVATRDKIKIDSQYKTLLVQCDISSTKIRETLDTIPT